MPAFDSNAFDAGFDISASRSFSFSWYDPFDLLMTKVCSVLTNQPAAPNSYGGRTLRPEDFTSLVDNWPCHISEKAFGRPHERDQEKSSSMNPMTFFMRPPQLSDGANLNPHHWLKTTGYFDPYTGIITPLEPHMVEYWNIIVVENPGGQLNHHLEVRVEELIP